jgi:hypothetical protein
MAQTVSVVHVTGATVGVGVGAVVAATWLVAGV